MAATEQCQSVNMVTPPKSFLLDCYQSSIQKGEIQYDPYQEQIMFELQRVYTDVLYADVPKPQEKASAGRFRKMFSAFGGKKQQSQKAELIEGLYLWGGVGRGKTHMVDFFYKLLPGDKKLRLHFHRFMQLVHEELKGLSHVEDPLYEVAKNVAGKTRILCLDEMHVNDITDAMLLGRLFEYMFDLGVALVTTSNVPPSGLYKDGLQRERFVPAIKLLEKNTRVIEIGGDSDYRLRTLEQQSVYHLSSDLSEQRLQNYYHHLTGVELHQDRTDIIINQRRIPVKAWADGVAWFSFDALCNTPRSTEDYVHIATYFHSVLVSDIPVMRTATNDAARRFVNMIDEFYDRNVNLIVSAEAIPEELYVEGKLAFEFQRTASRLREMQSTEYMKAAKRNS